MNAAIRSIPFQRIEASMVVKQARREGRLPRRKCPQCRNRALDLYRFREIQVDVCLVCEGIWLDAGELDTLLRRFQEARASKPPLPVRTASPGVSATDLNIPSELVFEIVLRIAGAFIQAALRK